MIIEKIKYSIESQRNFCTLVFDVLDGFEFWKA